MLFRCAYALTHLFQISHIVGDKLQIFIYISIYMLFC